MMKPAGLIVSLTLLACCSLTGCHQSQPVTRQELVGSYTYVSKDPANRPTDHAWDRLTLKADGHYDLVQGGPTKPKSEKNGTWQFYGGNPAEIALDLGLYPVNASHDEVRLMIDYDVGIWWAKAK